MHKFVYKFAYNPEMTEVAVIIESQEYITPEMYIGAMEAWLEYTRQHLHEMYKNRPVLEQDDSLN